LRLCRGLDSLEIYIKFATQHFENCSLKIYNTELQIVIHTVEN